MKCHGVAEGLVAGLVFAFVAPGVLRAQEPANVIGVVTDASTARPLFGATVVLDLPSGSRVTRTDQSGMFVFVRVATGTHTLAVRQLGYAPRTDTVAVVGETRLTIKLNRLAALDTVRVQGARQAIYGVVAAATEYRPIPNSTVEILGPSVGRVATDSAGRFFYPIQSTGAYVVRAKASGFLSQTVSVTIGKQKSVEVVLVLDDDGGQPNHAIEAAYFDFKQRLTRAGNASVLVPRSELIPERDGGLVAALLATPLFSSKGFRFSAEVCVFVDGAPRAGMSLTAVDIREVEAVEAYSWTAERSGTLEARWPSYGNCSDTGMPRNGTRKAGAQTVRWLVVWLKH